MVQKKIAREPVENSSVQEIASVPVENSSVSKR